MGSKPSKNLPTYSRQPSSEDCSDGTEYSDDDTDKETMPNAQEKLTRSTSLTDILSRVDTDMQVLAKCEEFDEKGILTKIRSLKKIYFALKSSRRDDLKKVCELMTRRGVLDIFTRMWDNFHKDKEQFYSNVKSINFKTLKMMKAVLMNYSDKCPDLSYSIYHHHTAVIERIMTELTLPELGVESLKKSMQKRHMVQYDLAIIINTLRHFHKIRELIRKDGGMDKIMNYSESSYLMLKVKVYIILAYCVDEQESDKISTSVGVVKFLVKILAYSISSPNHTSKRYGFSVEETLMAINKLASSDKNKVNFVEADVITYFTLLLNGASTSEEERFLVVNCIWTLAFHPENRKKGVFNQDIVNHLKLIQKDSDDSGNRMMHQACSSALFVIGIEQHQGNEKAIGRHIMISYNWEVQPAMLKLRDYLLNIGCEVWIDVDKMQDSILESMARAVENSAIILIAMTESYKNSNPCRTGSPPPRKPVTDI